MYVVNSSKISEMIQHISDIINELIKHTPYLKKIELKRCPKSQCEQRLLGRFVSQPYYASKKRLLVGLFFDDLMTVFCLHQTKKSNV